MFFRGPERVNSNIHSYLDLTTVRDKRKFSVIKHMLRRRADTVRTLVPLAIIRDALVCLREWSVIPSGMLIRRAKSVNQWVHGMAVPGREQPVMVVPLIAEPETLAILPRPILREHVKRLLR